MYKAFAQLSAKALFFRELRLLHNSLCGVFWSVDDSQCDQKSRIGGALLRR